MRRLFLLSIISFLSSVAVAQYRLVAKIISLPSDPKTEKIFIAGDFNNWNPADPEFEMKKDDNGNFYFEMDDIPAGSYSFKFTGGNWTMVEASDTGDDIPNRSLSINSDTIIELTIKGWKKMGPKNLKTSTALPQVQVLDPMLIPGLNRNRTIRIYLPADYGQTKAKYPVLYMHDGQNIFDNATSYAGEWGADEAMDSISHKWIIVGIDNGGEKRMNEYNPNDHKEFGKGEGREYVDFIVKVLKPFIDKKYRTLSSSENTAIAGSSMGGLISFYASLWYPNTFGKAGVFSPSFWIAPTIETSIDELKTSKPYQHQRMFFYAGGGEGRDMVPDMKRVAAKWEEHFHPSIKPMVIVLEKGQHNEPTWRAIFPEFIRWINQ